MDKYINMLFIQLSQKYKVNIITIMSYSDTYKKASKNYKLIIDKKMPEYPIKRVSIDFNSKRLLVMEMMKWAKETS